MIRSRDEESLTRLADDLGLGVGAVYSTFPSDYPFRLVVPKGEYAQWCYDEVVAIHYDNFKSQAARQRDVAFIDFLHRVWTLGVELTDARTRTLNDEAWGEQERQWDEGL